jgi:hypothetical protein
MAAFAGHLLTEGGTLEPRSSDAVPGRMPRSLLFAIVLAGGTAFAAAAPLPGRPPLEVAQWRWAEAIQDRQPIGNHQRYAPDRPLYIWFDLHGTQAALDELWNGHAPRIGGALAARERADARGAGSRDRSLDR